MQLKPAAAPNVPAPGEIMPASGRPAVMLITLLPLVWLLAATMTAGVQKIWHEDPRIGFLAQAKVQSGKAAAARIELAGAKSEAVAETARAELATASRLYNNQVLDAVVAGVFLVLVSIITLLSIRDWALLLKGRKPASLRETAPVWLPEHALIEPRTVPVAGMVALGLALARELSGEAQLERAVAQHKTCVYGLATDPAAGAAGIARGKLFAELTEEKFNGIRRCC
jgi:hypothetical protein